MTDSLHPADRPDEPVGAVLARRRKQRRLTGHALGVLVGMSQAKISRLETGAVAPEPSDVRMLAEALDMPRAEVERLVDLAERADERFTDWTSAQPGLADRERSIRRIEEPAKEFREFQPAVIPGLLQTSEYARAILSDLRAGLDDARIADSAVAVSEAVSARMQRNAILFGYGEFCFVITEQVLRNMVCAPADMIAQIYRVREVARYPNISLKIIVDSARLPIAPYHGFSIADGRVVAVDLFSSGLTASGRQTVQTYRRVFDALEQAGTAEAEEILDRYQTHYARMLLPR